MKTKNAIYRFEYINKSRLIPFFTPMVLIIILSTFSSNLMAQRRDNPPPAQSERLEKLESMKIAFFTQRLDFTPEEAKKFWPVYNAFQDDLEKFRKGRRESLMDAKNNFDKLTDKEIEKLVDNEIIFKQNELDVIKKYHSQFKQVLPPRKVAKLYRAEEDWKRKILDMWKERKEEKSRGNN